MAYFKINKSGCQEHKGLCEIRYDLYLEPADEGYEEHHVGDMDNPFCCHFCQFEPTVTDEEILFVGELALDMARKNWAKRELHKNKNLPCNLLSRTVYDQAKSSAAKVGKVGTEKLEPHIESAISKIQECKARMESFHMTDLVAFEKTIPTGYSIRG